MKHFRTFSWAMSTSEKIASGDRLGLFCEKLGSEYWVTTLCATSNEDCPNAPERSLGLKVLIQAIAIPCKVPAQVGRVGNFNHVVGAESECFSEFWQIVGRIEERPSLANQMADEQVTIAGIILKCRPWVKKEGKMTYRDMTGFVIESDDQQVGVGVVGLIGAGETPKK